MTIPRRGTLKSLQASKSFQAQADVGINSPVQTNSQNINVMISPLTKDKVFATLNRADTEYKELPAQERSVSLEGQEQPLDDNLEPNFGSLETRGTCKERSIESAEEGLEEMKQLLKDKDNLIEALSLILDIYENNPLIVNKFIVAKEDELSRLLFLLTGAEQIELIKNEPEVGCCSKATKYTYVSKIMVKKNGNTYNFKYSFPNVVQLLDNRRITWKLVY